MFMHTFVIEWMIMFKYRLKEMSLVACDINLNAIKLFFYNEL